MKELLEKGPKPRPGPFLGWCVSAIGALALFWVESRHDPVPSVVRLELAWRTSSAQNILQQWGAHQSEIARTSIRLDYWFIIFYFCAIAGLCLFGARRVPGSRHPRSRLGLAMASGVGMAAIFDAMENSGMSRMLDSGSGHLAPVVSTFATIKFVLVGLGLLYGMLSGLSRLAQIAENVIDHQRTKTGGVVPGVVATQMKLGAHALSGEPATPPRPSGGILLLRWLIGLPLSFPFSPPKPAVPDPSTTGICCSGGGIRSAAYNLGALQTLQAEGVLKTAKYLASVSGGSYIAASYAMVISRSDPAATDPAPYAPGSPEEHFLKTHSAYLGPPGIAGKSWMLVRLLAGMAVNFGFVIIFLYLVARPLGWWYAQTLQRGLAGARRRS